MTSRTPTNWQGLDDSQLVDHALAGSEDAYREIVRRFERPIYGLILRLVRDAATAEDLAQETFLKAFNALPRYDRQHKMASWLFKIAHNTSIDWMRRRGLPTVSLSPAGEGETDFAELLPDPGAETPEHSAERADLGRALEQALVSLRPEYREVMVLRFREGLAYEEIAEVTSLPLGTVKTHIHRARKQLAVVLSAAGWAPE